MTGPITEAVHGFLDDMDERRNNIMMSKKAIIGGTAPSEWMLSDDDARQFLDFFIRLRNNPEMRRAEWGAELNNWFEKRCEYRAVKAVADAQDILAERAGS
jgi:hypothetical protein